MLFSTACSFLSTSGYVRSLRYLCNIYALSMKLYVSIMQTSNGNRIYGSSLPERFFISLHFFFFFSFFRFNSLYELSSNLSKKRITKRIFNRAHAAWRIHELEENLALDEARQRERDDIHARVSLHLMQWLTFKKLMGKSDDLKMTNLERQVGRKCYANVTNLLRGTLIQS